MADTTKDGEVSNWDALVKAFVMIVVSEIGDKTFLIAAIMASRHPRITVFAGAFLSLVVMSVLSAALGKVILGLIPKVWTLWAAALLFLLFGLKMVHEASTMSASHLSEEMREVEEELEHDSATHDPSNPHGQAVPLEDLEAGMGMGAGGMGSSSRRASGSGSLSGRSSPVPGIKNSLSAPSPSTPTRSPSRSASRARSPSPRRPLTGSATSGGAKGKTSPREAIRNTIQLLTSPVFAQAFVLTFLGEWGDRSQITTIAMGGAHSIPVIAFGTILGHGLCTAGAVMGGRYLSTKISVKQISLIGAAAFLIFGIMYALEAWQTPWDAQADDGFEW